jgi:hypothetical protein
VKLSRVMVIVVVVVLVAIVGLYAVGVILAPTTSTSAGSTWHSAAGYPVQVSGTFAIAGQQCFNGTSYVYCIGGQDANGGPRDEVYSTPALTSSSGNITAWTAGTQYPQDINGQSCVAYSGYAYCTGGTYDDGGDDVNSSYYAPLTSGGALGTWSATTSFPIPVDSLSCVASSGYVYCVGGNNETDGTNADSTSSNSVWYAALSSSGLGDWTSTTSYPANVFFPSCFAAGGYIYCLGGVNGNFNAVGTDYFASLSAAGVGAWTQTTAYPVQASGEACAVSSGRIYCIGGEEAEGSYTGAAYYASVSSAGVGTWKQMPSYPLSSQTDCAIVSGNLYCVGGFDGSSVGENNAVYYASLDSLTG